MPRVIRRVAAKRDLTEHFVFLGENASIEVARRFLQAVDDTFQSLSQMPEMGRREDSEILDSRRFACCPSEDSNDISSFTSPLRMGSRC